MIFRENVIGTDFFLTKRQARGYVFATHISSAHANLRQFENPSALHNIQKIKKINDVELNFFSGA